MNDYHQPFLKALVLCAVVTLVSMAFSRIIIERYINYTYSTPSFTSQNSQLSEDNQ